MHKVAIIILASCISLIFSCAPQEKSQRYDPKTTPGSNKGKVAGRILSATNGEPVGNASVKILDIGLRAESKYNGDYIINNVPIGTFNIVASRQRFREDTVKDVLVVENQTTLTHFNLIEGRLTIHRLIPFDPHNDKGQIIGRVIDMLTKEPIESATIHITSKSVLSDSAGAYKLTDIRPGYWQIQARPENIGYWFTSPKNVYVEKGKQSVVDFELVWDQTLMSSYEAKYEISNECSTAGKIQGRVINKTNGESLFSCWIQLLNSEIKTTTDLSGNFAFDSIPPGRYNIDVKMMGYNAVVAETVLVKIGKITIIEFKLSLVWYHVDY